MLETSIDQILSNLPNGGASRDRYGERTDASPDGVSDGRDFGMVFADADTEGRSTNEALIDADIPADTEPLPIDADVSETDFDSDRDIEVAATDADLLNDIDTNDYQDSLADRTSDVGVLPETADGRDSIAWGDALGTRSSPTPEPWDALLPNWETSGAGWPGSRTSLIGTTPSRGEWLDGSTASATASTQAQGRLDTGSTNLQDHARDTVALEPDSETRRITSEAAVATRETRAAEGVSQLPNPEGRRATSLAEANERPVSDLPGRRSHLQTDRQVQEPQTQNGRSLSVQGQSANAPDGVRSAPIAASDADHSANLQSAETSPPESRISRESARQAQASSAWYVSQQSTGPSEAGETRFTDQASTRGEVVRSVERMQDARPLSQTSSGQLRTAVDFLGGPQVDTDSSNLSPSDPRAVSISDQPGTETLTPVQNRNTQTQNLMPVSAELQSPEPTTKPFDSTRVPSELSRVLRDEATRDEPVRRREPLAVPTASVTQPLGNSAPIAKAAPLDPKRSAMPQSIFVGDATIKGFEFDMPLSSPTTSMTSHAETSAPLRQPGTPLFQHPDLPRHVVQQLSAFLKSGAEQVADIFLNPAELGRVRMSLNAGEHSILVSILADRPETLDLLRRHIDLLAQEFHDIGYGSAEFSFGEGHSPDAQADAAMTNSTGAAAEEDATAAEAVQNHAKPTKPSPSIDLDRIDLRL